MTNIYDKKFSELQQEAAKINDALSKTLEEKQKCETIIDTYKNSLLRIDGAMLVLNELKQEELQKEKEENESKDSQEEKEENN